MQWMLQELQRDSAQRFTLFIVVVKKSFLHGRQLNAFGRIFYRNAINIGLPILECPEAAAEIAEGDLVSVDFDAGVILDETTGKRYTVAPMPAFMQDILTSGGLIEAVKAGKLEGGK